VAIINFFVTIYLAMIISVLKIYFETLVSSLTTYFATINIFVTSVCFKFNKYITDNLIALQKIDFDKTARHWAKPSFCQSQVISISWNAADNELSPK